MPAINSSAPPRNLSSAPSGISTKSPIGGTLNNTWSLCDMCVIYTINCDIHPLLNRLKLPVKHV